MGKITGLGGAFIKAKDPKMPGTSNTPVSALMETPISTCRLQMLKESLQQAIMYCLFSHNIQLTLAQAKNKS